MTDRRARLLAGLIIAVISALCLAACGSSSSGSSSSGSASAAASGGRPNAAERARLAACLKKHGVTLPTRPRGARPGAGGSGSGGGASGFSGGGGRGFFGGGGAGQGPASSKFRAAFQACGAGAGFRGRRAFRPSSAAIATFAACVKRHGFMLPNANLSGKGPVYPVTIEHAQKFQSAARACQSALRPAGRNGSAPAGGAPPGA